MKCTCDNVPMGSYANQDALRPPWGGPRVGIDRCIRAEIEELWALGVHTIESCCGHRTAPPYVAVVATDGPLIEVMGYREIVGHPGCYAFPSEEQLTK